MLELIQENNVIIGIIIGIITLFITMRQIIISNQKHRMDKEDFISLCDKVFRGETLIVSRPKNENIVMMSESEYNEIMKAKRNAEYLAMLDKSMAEAEAGGFITKTVDELGAYE